MKILYWTPFFLPDIGGVETLSANLVPELQRRGHQIVVVTSHGRYKVPDTTHFNGIPVHRFHFRQAISNNSLPQIVRIRRSISELKRDFQPDVIHIHITDPSIYFHMSTRKSHPAPLLLSLHQGYSHFDLEHHQNSLFHRALQEAEWVTGVSEMTLADSRKLAPSIKARSSVVYNGLQPLSQPPRQLSFDPPHILCPARLVPQKALHLAIDAFATIHKHFPTSMMTIAGNGVLRSELEQQVIELGLADNVRFTGEVKPDEMPYFLQTATVVLLSSDTEGLPMTVIEAGQMARPVVSTDVGGVAEAVVNGKTGILVKPGDSSKLASAIIDLLKQPEKMQRMGDAARQHIQEKFSLSTCADAYEQLYVRLAAQYNSSPNGDTKGVSI